MIFARLSFVMPANSIRRPQSKEIPQSCVDARDVIFCTLKAHRQRRPARTNDHLYHGLEVRSAGLDRQVSGPDRSVYEPALVSGERVPGDHDEMRVPEQ